MMNYRIFSLRAIALALLVVNSPAYAAQEAVRWTHLGKVVSFTGNQPVMTNAQGNADRACTLTADVQVTCDGEACKSSDLRPGMKIRMTAESDDPNTATQLKQSDAEIARLREKGSELKDEAKANWERKMANLETKRDAARAKLAEIGASSAEEWKDVRKGAQSAWDELDQAFRDASQEF